MLSRGDNWRPKFGDRCGRIRRGSKTRLSFCRCSGPPNSPIASLEPTGICTCACACVPILRGASTRTLYFVLVQPHEHSDRPQSAAGLFEPSAYVNLNCINFYHLGALSDNRPARGGAWRLRLRGDNRAIDSTPLTIVANFPIDIIEVRSTETCAARHIVVAPVTLSSSHKTEIRTSHCVHGPPN